MILPDVDVLIYAFGTDLPRHRICRPWLESIAGGDAQFGLSPLALSAVARIATNPRIFKLPSAIEEVFLFCDALLDRANCEVVRPGDRHWAIFKRLCANANVKGPVVADAWFAALAIEHGCVWITYDRDYTRFPGLDWREPTV